MRAVAFVILFSVSFNAAAAEVAEAVADFVDMVQGGKDAELGVPEAEGVQASAGEREEAESVVWSESYPTFSQVPEGAPKFDPAARDTLFERLELSLVQEDPDVAALEAFVQQWPDHLQARLWLARSLLRLDQVEQALAVLKNVGPRQARDWQTLYWLGTAKLLDGDLDGARTALMEAQSAAPEWVALWIQHAAVEQEAGNHAGAVQLLKIAESLDGDDALVHLNLAYSLEQLGEYADALRAYQRYMTSEQRQARHLRAAVMRRIAELSGALRASQLATDQPS